MKLIELLSNGEIAVQHTGTKEELKRVLNAAFPKDNYDIDRDEQKVIKKNNFYYVHHTTEGKWLCHRTADLPSYPVSDFIKELDGEWTPKRGERVLVRDSKDQKTCLATIEGSCMPYIVVSSSHEKKFLNGEKIYICLLQPNEALEEVEEMTIEQVCKELGRKIKIVE